jgi:hypothetical protein
MVHGSQAPIERAGCSNCYIIPPSDKYAQAARSYAQARDERDFGQLNCLDLSPSASDNDHQVRLLALRLQNQERVVLKIEACEM